MNIYSLSTGNKIFGCVTFEYKGYEISATTGFADGTAKAEIVVFPSRNSKEFLFSTYDMSATGIKAAMDFIDNL